MSLITWPLRWWLVASAGLLTACVTVNIYFPAAAAEKAADKIIQDVWGEQPQSAPAAPSPEPPAPSGGLDDADEQRLAGLRRWVDIVLPAAWAQANININTPAINRLKNSMAARFRQLQPFYSSGAVGLTRDGLVTVRAPNAVPLPQRSQVNQLVAAENRDRNTLYREIATANGQPQWEPEIRATFARQWIENARRGWWYQSQGGGWQQK